MKGKATIILLIIIVSLVPLYLLNKYLEKIIKPKESFGKLFLYLFAMLVLIFGYTFLLVFTIKKIYPEA